MATKSQPGSGNSQSNEQAQHTHTLGSSDESDSGGQVREPASGVGGSGSAFFSSFSFFSLLALSTACSFSAAAYNAFVCAEAQSVSQPVWQPGRVECQPTSQSVSQKGRAGEGKEERTLLASSSPATTATAPAAAARDQPPTTIAPSGDSLCGAKSEPSQRSHSFLSICWPLKCARRLPPLLRASQKSWDFCTNHRSARK